MTALVLNEQPISFIAFKLSLFIMPLNIASIVIAGNMGMYTLPKEAGTSFEDWTMDDEDRTRCRGQRDATTDAGGHGSPGWSSGTRRSNAG